MYRPFYHPYQRPPAPLSPAGFRFGDFVPNRRCFNFFRGPQSIDARSPDSSPLASPVRDAPPPDNEAPHTSTVSVSELFPGAFNPPPRPSTTPATYGLLDANAAAEPPPPSPRRKHRAPKQRSLLQEERSCQLSDHLKAKREAFRRKHHGRYERRMLQGRQGLDRLLSEAKMLMKPQHMNAEDRIFWKQLRDLGLDNTLEHALERHRQQVARAAAESDDRRKAHEAMDAEFHRRRVEARAEAIYEAEARRVESFKRREEEAREALFRRLEEEAMREDEKRQRAYQAAERKMREWQDRRFHEELARRAEEERRIREEQLRRAEEERRMREEQARKAEEEERRRRAEERRQREEKDRQERAERERRQREQERCQREEEERRIWEDFEQLRREAYSGREEQERFRAEQARRAAEEEQIRQYFLIYEAKWNELRTNASLAGIDLEQMPWPVFGVVVSADQMSAEFVKTFLFHPLRPDVEGKTMRDKVKAEMLRFHPDKFNARVLTKIKASQQAAAQAIAGAAARILTDLMAELN